MIDLHDRYLGGVGDLLQAVEPATEDYLVVLTLQGRLAQAIWEVRQYGSTENARNEIARITTELDRLCLMHLGQSFQSLCGIKDLPEAIPTKIYHNLRHPDYGNFVGREKELAQVHALLSPDSRHFLVTIDGIGGIGKSTLALEVAHHYLDHASNLPEPQRFDAIIWISAKQETLTGDGIEPTLQAIRTLSDIFTTISVTLEREDITRARRKEQPILVSRALARKRALLILDNLESIHDEAVLTFLRELPVPTKCIATTRQRIDVAYRIQLTGMSWADAEQLIIQECEKRSVILTGEQTSKLYSRTGGIPLAMVWSISQMGFGRDANVVLGRLGQPRGDVVRFCFHNAIERIRDTDAYKLVLALTLFEAGASREALSFVTGFENDTVSLNEALVQLDKLSLVHKHSDRYSMLPLSLAMTRDEFANHHEFSKMVREKWVQYYEDWIDAYCEQALAANQLGFQAERRNILDVITWCQQEQPAIAIRLTERLGEFLYSKGYWSDLRPLCDRALQLATSRNQSLSRARLKSILGRMGIYQRLFDEAESDLEEAGRLFADSGDVAAHLHSLSYLAIAIKENGKSELAASTLNEALVKAREIGLRRQVARIENIMAANAIEARGFETAESLLEEAMDILDGEHDGQYIGLTASYRLMGRLHMERNQLGEAYRWFSRSLDISRKTAIIIDQAYSLKWLGILAARRGDSSSSRDYLAQAAEAFERLGMVDEALEDRRGNGRSG